MKELFTCANCGDCAVKLGFGFTFPDTYICTLGCAGVPMQAIEAIEADVDGRVGYGCEVLD